MWEQGADCWEFDTFDLFLLGPPARLCLSSLWSIHQ
jgi:hypothetical protein